MIRITSDQLAKIANTDAASASTSTSKRVSSVPAVPETLPGAAASGGELSIAHADQAFWFGIPFPIRSKSNFRRGGATGSSEWKDQSRFESDIRSLSARWRPSSWELGPGASSKFQQRPHIVGFLFARGMLDTGNISKSVLDGCEGVVFHNDASVRTCLEIAERARTGRFGLVGFASLAAKPDHKLTVEVAAALSVAVLKHLD